MATQVQSRWRDGSSIIAEMAPEQLSFVELGLAAALRAGMEPKCNITLLPVEKLVGWAASLRGLTAGAAR